MAQLNKFAESLKEASALESFWNGWVTARAEKGKSLPQNIYDLFFKEGAPLSNEYENLYNALFNKPDQYMKIVEALSTVNKGITRDEISEITGIAFERVCLEHTAQIKAALGISGVYTEVNAWQCGKDEEKGITGSQITSDDLFA